jgi:anaerobic selenocysteine-containing dehydrogenase
MNSSLRYRACPLCEAICGLEFKFDGAALSAIRGDSSDPFSRGHICPKGNAILDLEADPERLRQPLQRTAAGWQKISWDDAFTLAGERLAAIQAKHGDNAVAAYLGNPNVHHFGHIAYLSRFLRTLKTRNIYSASSVDQWPHQIVAWAMFGHQFLIPIVDLDRTDFVLMLGANPVASNGSLLTAPGIAKRLKALVQRGQLVVVDPRRTQTAELANLHLPIKPAADVWLLLALLQKLQKLGAPKLAHYGAQLSGFSAALAAVNSIDCSDVSARTGIDAAQIEALALQLHQAPTAAVYGRMGVSTQRYGTLCQYLIQLINIYGGNLDRVGGVLPNDPVMPVTGPGTAKGARGRWHSRVRGLPEFAGELPAAVLAEEILTPANGPDAPSVRALFTSAGNPVLSTPDGRQMERALHSLEFMLSMDIYLNETTRYADLILPPSSFLAQHHYDVIFNSFAVRRVARWNQPIILQAPDERADWQIINGIAAAYAKASGKAWTDLAAPEVLIEAGLRAAGKVDVAQLRAAEHGLDLGPLEPSLLGRLETASGHIECAPDFLLADLAQLSALGALETDAAGVEAGALQLIGRRDVRSNNSWMHNAPRLIKGDARHQLHLHPTDMQARGLSDGQRVRVHSRVGSVETEVAADAAMQVGVACLPHGFGHQREGNGASWSRANALAGASYNDLSDTHHLDLTSGNAAVNGMLVWVEAIRFPTAQHYAATVATSGATSR